MDERERHLVEVLVTKARRGDPEAFTRLVERYSPHLTRFVRCLVGNPHDAQDVLQDAWLEAWRCFGNYRDGAAFRPWLFGIAKYRVERLRRGKRTVMPLDEANELAAPGDIREDAQSKEEVERLRQCLDRLRPEERRGHRTALYRRYELPRDRGSHEEQRRHGTLALVSRQAPPLQLLPAYAGGHPRVD